MNETINETVVMDSEVIETAEAFEAPEVSNDGIKLNKTEGAVLGVCIAGVLGAGYAAGKGIEAGVKFCKKKIDENKERNDGKFKLFGGKKKEKVVDAVEVVDTTEDNK